MPQPVSVEEIKQLFLPLKKQIDETFTAKFLESLKARLAIEIERKKQGASEEEQPFLYTDNLDAKMTEHLNETVVDVYRSLLNVVKQCPSREELEVIKDSIQKTSTFISELRDTVQQGKDEVQLISAAKELKSAAAEVNAKMKRPVWRVFVGALLGLAGIVTMITGALTTPWFVGLGISAGGLVLAGIGIKMTEKTDKEEAAGYVKTEASILSGLVCGFFAQKQAPIPEQAGTPTETNIPIILNHC